MKDVGLNPTRTGIIDVLIRMGARIREVIETSLHGEPIGNIDIKGTTLQATTICGAEIPNVIDEIPVIAVAAALANGTTIIRDAAELRVKETDRIAAVASNLRAMGVTVEEFPDGMAITGGSPLKGAKLPCHGDHRIAMAFAVAGLFAEGETIIEDTACVNTSYPGFAEALRHIQKVATSREAHLFSADSKHPHHDHYRHRRTGRIRKKQRRQATRPTHRILLCQFGFDVSGCHMGIASTGH